LDNSDDEMALAIFLRGNNHADNPVPGNFLKLINSGFKESSSDTFKAKQLENGFATNLVAELWFDTLNAPTKAYWGLLKAPFKGRRPKEVILPLTVNQGSPRLQAEKLAKEDIRVIVMANRVEMTGQAQWASKILALSALAEDPTSTLIHSVQDGMPDIMKKLVKGMFGTWSAFCVVLRQSAMTKLIMPWPRRSKSAPSNMNQGGCKLSRAPQPLSGRHLEVSTSIICAPLQLPLYLKCNSFKVVQWVPITL
jgi:hypothetical protein